MATKLSNFEILDVIVKDAQTGTDDDMLRACKEVIESHKRGEISLLVAFAFLRKLIKAME